MAILIDPPQWPAHGTLWSHLVSDTSYAELHAFAARLGVPRRSFDLDHYDVPASRYEQAVSLGARPVLARDVVFQLRTSGLRVRQVERDAVRPVRRREYLVAEWAGLADAVGLGGSTTAFAAWQHLGDELVARWNEPHRAYHDERHLEDVLLALDHLATRGERVFPATLLAAWFHDAVYVGASGSDERDSAHLAAVSLLRLDLAPAFVQHVGELIVATTPALPHAHTPAPLAHLLDADLSIFASPASRYTEYSLAVRREFAHVAEPEFRAGRSRILTTYLDQPAIYRTDTARVLWEDRARGNLVREVEALRSAGPLAE